MYKNGSRELHQKLKELKEKILGPNVDVEIQEGRSAVENYLTLNKLTRVPRRIVPLTSSKQLFVNFSLRELAGFFFAHGGVLRARIQELLRGLLTVKYKRLPDDRLPPRLTSTIHGTDNFLTEIRNVLGTKEDVASLWPGIDPQNIETLTLDAGQAYVVGAYAYLPRNLMNEDETPSFKGSLLMASYSTTTLQDLMQTLSLGPQTSSRPPAITTASDKTPHHNIAVRQKAVMQLVFRYGRWLGDEKQLKTEGPERQHQSKPDIELLSVAEIESQLPPLRCPQASIVDYVNKLEEVGIRFMDFYNGNNNKFQKYNWDMKRAKYIEYQAIANSLLRI
ncbi:hypothetical protein BGZ80_007662, partial [Entomortierella chlamydospora]